MKHVPSLFSVVLVLCAACAQPVNLGAVPAAINGCEKPSADNLTPEPPMLPGRHCQACHAASGQASLFPWTAAGTVYGGPTAPCDTGGLSDVKVEITDETDRVIMTLTTNRSGNFFTAETLNFKQVRARVSKGGKSQEMISFQPSADCGGCHYPAGVAGGRIFLN